MSRYRVNAEKAVWRVLDGEAVIVHADTSAYYGLNATATFVWAAVAAAPLSTDEIADEVAARYGLAASDVRGELHEFLSQLHSAGLVDEIDAREGGQPMSAPRDPGAPNGEIYERPELAAFGDLERLILSGE